MGEAGTSLKRGSFPDVDTRLIPSKRNNSTRTESKQVPTHGRGERSGDTACLLSRTSDLASRAERTCQEHI